jgi:LacI family transcriptional regulator
VQPDWRRIGYEASVLLDRLMQGDSPPDAPRLIQPVGVVTRRSTDALAIADREVVDAMRFITDHAAERIDVNDILRALPVARRSLERKFRKYVGHSPARQIKQAQIQHIKRLLIQNDWPMPKIAAASAFHDPGDLSKQFRKETGLTPTAYRRQHRSY